jgi:hypothetical protein
MFHLVFRRMQAHVKESRTHMTWLMLMLRGEEKKKQDNNEVVILYWERLCVGTMAECRAEETQGIWQSWPVRPAGGHRPPATAWQRARGRRRPWSIAPPPSIQILMYPLFNLPGIQL